MSFVLGGPCSGKGYFCSRVEDRSNGMIKALSAGDLLRKEVKSGGPLAESIDRLLLQGRIVPAEITIKLMVQEMMNSKVNHFLVDGFPRNKDNFQSFFFPETDFQHPPVLRVYFINASWELMRKRLEQRSKKEAKVSQNQSCWWS